VSDKSKLDSDYERGFEAGKSLRPSEVELKARYGYLKYGGEWDKHHYDSPDDYLAGFEDAMKTLGVKP
jgi:hypothetical protein